MANPNSSPVLIFLLLILYAYFRLSMAADTLLPRQTMSVGQTLVSPNQIFEMGFFSPGTSKNSFLGIWYRATPDIVVWVANRNDAVTDSHDLHLAILENQTLAVVNAGRTVWISLPSFVASDPVLHLLDSGNLVLANGTAESNRVIWQSFDYPTDTWLPGMKIVGDAAAGVERNLTSWKSPDDPSQGDFVFKIHNHGLPEMVVLWGGAKVYRSGKWNGRYFNGGPRFQSNLFTPEIEFRGEEMVSIWEAYKTGVVKRIHLGMSGGIRGYTMNTRRDRWNHAFSTSRDACDRYAECGPNGLCRISMAVRCACFPGFEPRFPEDWNDHGWSGGCRRVKPLDCRGEDDGFLQVKGVNYPDMLHFQFQLNRSLSIDECRAECLSKCNCTAYANPYLDNGGTGCLMWLGDLVDTRQLIATDDDLNLFIRLPRTELDAIVDLEEEKNKEKKKSKRMLELISIISGILVLGIVNGGVLLMARRKGRGDKVEKNGDYLELPVFNLASIMDATNNFSTENKLGEGGFGPVYKGKFSAVDEIAVKRLSRDSKQGIEEFKNEIKLIAKLQHRNLVRLLGCCIDGDERMLIYEYMPNKSLDNFVFDQDRKTLLPWPERFQIITRIVRGLLYLHHDSRLKIIHRDLKTSNILLDQNWNPRISDFGLARIFGEDQSVARTRKVVGTYGYMSPEYAVAGKFSEKSDIFSLGVVLLEIVSGKKNSGFHHIDPYRNLLGHAWVLWKENRALEVMDECLKRSMVKSEVMRCVQVGLLCVQGHAQERPEMASVYSMLTAEGAVLPEPNEPGFFVPGFSSSPAAKSCPSSCEMSVKETITITDLDGR